MGMYCLNNCYPLGTSRESNPGYESQLKSDTGRSYQLRHCAFLELLLEWC